MKHDHEAAKERAENMKSNLLFPSDERNLAACYLDSVPKAQYEELRRLAQAVYDDLQDPQPYGHASNVIALRTFLEAK